jgi:hypothetical protein
MQAIAKPDNASVSISTRLAKLPLDLRHDKQLVDQQPQSVQHLEDRKAQKLLKDIAKKLALQAAPGQRCALKELAMTVGKGKRPRDPNQLAKWIVDHSTGETPEQNMP